METALGNLYGNIVAHLVDYVPVLKTVDIDLGQIKSGGEKLPLELPAAILKLENVVWQQYDAAKRIGIVHVRLKILVPFLNDEENYAAPHSVRNEVLAFYELLHDIRQTINGITSGYHTKLYLFNESHLKSTPEDLKWTYCIDLQCNIYSDDSEIADSGGVTIDTGTLELDNAFMERTDLSVVKIGEK